MDNVCRPKRRLLRYSFATLLFAITCVCGYLSGYRSGYNAGDNTWHYGITYVQTYNVGDLVVPTPTVDPLHHGKFDYDSLVNVVEDVGLDQPKEECIVRPFEQNSSLVVTGNGVVHRRIHALLTDLRKNAPNSQHEDVETRNTLQ
jgi:hypothetical protein